MLKKIISFVLSFSLITSQPVFAQGVAQINLGNYLRTVGSSMAMDKFRPLHMRYFSYDMATDNFQLLLDKGDNKDIKEGELEEKTKVLMDYFKIGLSLPNEKFWVNLRPDAQDQIIDPELEKTDIGKIMLEADLQLKKDTSGMTSPQTPEGKAYWDKLYKKAGELFGSENITIPTITRPWIVPGEIILRQGEDSAYIFKANMKVMLEEDYLNNQKTEKPKNQKTDYNFPDPRMKELNKYSSQLIRELIIPKLTKEVNTSKRYAALRQVFFSLVMARWFKDTFGSSGSASAPGARAPESSYIKLIDSGDLNNLISKESWSKTYYFNEYKKSFENGEYNLKEEVFTPTGPVIRSYVSGGTSFVKSWSKYLTEKIAGVFKGRKVLYSFIKDSWKTREYVIFNQMDAFARKSENLGANLGKGTSSSMVTQADLDKELTAAVEAINRGKEPANALKYIKVAPTGILLASTSHNEKRYHPGSVLITYVVDEQGNLKDETWRPDGINPVVKENTIILSNGSVKYPVGHALAGQGVRGRYNNEGAFVIDQENGPDILQNEYLTDVDFVTNPANYGITPTTNWQYGSKTVPNYVVHVPANAEGNFAITTKSGTKINIKGGDYVVINTKKGKADGMQGVQAIQFAATYVDYAEYMAKLGKGTSSSMVTQADKEVVTSVIVPSEVKVRIQISRYELERLATVSKQIREKTVSAVPGNFKQVDLDTSSREAYLNSIARYYEQQYGFPMESLTVSFPVVAPLSGNEVVFLSIDGKPLAVIKIFLRSERDVPFGGEALREIESSVVLRNKNISVPEIYDVVSANNIDVNNPQRPLMVVSALAQGGDMASRLRVLIKADAENDRDSINGIIEEARSVGEALGKLHDSFPPPAGLNAINNDYDYNRMKQAIEQLYNKGEIGQEERNKLNILVDELFRLMARSGIRLVAVHGDFHGGNVFIKNGRASDFIDTETIFWSLDSEYRGTGNPANDLARFLDNLHDRLVESTVSTYIINALEEAFLDGYSRTRNIAKETFRDAIEFYKARTALVALQYSPSEYAKQSAKRRLRAYLNRKSIAELTEKLASDLHEGWRAPRRLSTSDYRVAQGILFEPRPKPLDPVVDKEWLERNNTVKVYDMSKLQQLDLPVSWSEKEKLNAMREKGKIVIDIANTAYIDLSPSWQSENRNAAESATRLIGRRLAEGKQVTLEDKEWIEEASAIIHREWLKRPANSWALNDPELNKEYSLLSEEQKNKNIDIIVQGIKLYNPLNFVAVSSSTARIMGSEGEFPLALQTQEAMRVRISEGIPRHGFVKDAPIMGWHITSTRFEDIPEAIREHLGAVDQTQYTPEYLVANLGSILALQMNGDKPDFYIIGKDTFNKKYKVVHASEVSVKNKKVFNKLQGVKGMAGLIASGDEHLIGALKIVPVQMIKMSEIGYPVETEVKIQSPWGEQTKPVGQDAYLVWDESQNQYYMVNTDSSGNPISYVRTSSPITGEQYMRSLFDGKYGDIIIGQVGDKSKVNELGI